MTCEQRFLSVPVHVSTSCSLPVLYLYVFLVLLIPSQLQTRMIN